ncbi:MAG: 6-carboxytetrahydropterin synthase [Kiritimatiellae bacterium]|nr:6-carboxytetrahydropterin synthase [Kiritimatiellia bacterium]
MPYRVSKKIEIDSAHLLSKHAGECRFPHGHTRQIEVVLESDRLAANDMVCDFARLKAAMTACVADWDHAFCMNRDDPRFAQLQSAFGSHVTGFAGRDPTTEVLAEELYRRIEAELPGLGNGVRLRRVRVWETASCWAEYEPARP